MHTHNTIHSISSLAESAQRTEPGHHPGEEKARNVITLSAGTGTGGKEVAEILAKRLGIDLYDKEIVALLAREAHLDKSVLERLDERLDGFKGAWLYSFLTGENISEENYLRNLTNVLRGIACRGGVIFGRGANFILADLSSVLRVHIVGTFQTCVDRLAAQEDITRKEASLKIQETDKARCDYIKELFKCDNESAPVHFDLIINSDHLAPAHIADLILQAREHAEFE
uniref:Cytidylate kinase n=1 Tax=Candidatus Kentrum eta TaxID=2126337 RepID=A0A450UXV5_9GAMM|nr:MAG: Cytidylate kinase [Candidatus Kentron sp. H]VFJ97358.1 MAG: Cytidylate kinase [Candidatus Kentron sp. H]VFK02679.1 MAG: Cytidylate kinase [Candidatus Kentron sp. H]